VTLAPIGNWNCTNSVSVRRHVLCEKCHAAEAAVHLTELVADAPGEMKKHNFCAACFDQTDLAKRLGGKMDDATSSGFSATILPNDETGR
jgi:protein-arginine kinase activator protein McsA